MAVWAVFRSARVRILLERKGCPAHALGNLRRLGRAFAWLRPALHTTPSSNSRQYSAPPFSQAFPVPVTVRSSKVAKSQSAASAPPAVESTAFGGVTWLPSGATRPSS